MHFINVAIPDFSWAVRRLSSAAAQLVVPPTCDNYIYTFLTRRLKDRRTMNFSGQATLSFGESLSRKNREVGGEIKRNTRLFVNGDDTAHGGEMHTINLLIQNQYWIIVFLPQQQISIPNNNASSRNTHRKCYPLSQSFKRGWLHACHCRGG